MKYAIYVENGHRQKPGRFVPQLGVRLKQPLIPPKHMMARAEDNIRPKVNGMLREREDAWIEARMECTK
jgi:hypothetical protein